jgi:hypothetical protein
MAGTYTRRNDGKIYALVLKNGKIETDDKGNAILYYNRDAAVAAKERKGEREVCVFYRPRPKETK